MGLRRQYRRPPLTPTEVDIVQAVQQGERYLAALRLLARTIGAATPDRLAMQDQAVQLVRGRVVCLAAEMETVRVWALETEHFIASLHPIPPSFLAGAEPREG